MVLILFFMKSENSLGFTLIEMLIYLALFSMIMGGAIVATYQIIQTTQALQTHILDQQEADFMFHKTQAAAYQIP